MNDGLLWFWVCAVMALVLVLYPLRRYWPAMVIVSLLFISGIILGYGHWGNWSRWQSYVQQQALLHTFKSPDALIVQLKARVEAVPVKARGWFLLGRLYACQGQWVNAYHAYAKAHRLLPDDEATTVHYAEALWEHQHRRFNKDIRRLFQEVLQHNPNQADALAMLAMDAYTRQVYQEAIDYWERLLKQVPQGSEEALAIQQAIVKAQRR